MRVQALENLLVDHHFEYHLFAVFNVDLRHQKAGRHDDVIGGLPYFEDHLEDMQTGFPFVGRHDVTIGEFIENYGHNSLLYRFHVESVRAPTGRVVSENVCKKWGAGVKKSG